MGNAKRKPTQKHNKLNFLWPNIAHLIDPRKCFYFVSQFTFLYQEKRHVFFSGGGVTQNRGLGQEVYVVEAYVCVFVLFEMAVLAVDALRFLCPLSRAHYTALLTPQHCRKAYQSNKQ